MRKRSESVRPNSVGSSRRSKISRYPLPDFLCLFREEGVNIRRKQYGIGRTETVQNPFAPNFPIHYRPGKVTHRKYRLVNVLRRPSKILWIKQVRIVIHEKSPQVKKNRS